MEWNRRYASSARHPRRVRKLRVKFGSGIPFAFAFVDWSAEMYETHTFCFRLHQQTPAGEGAGQLLPKGSSSGRTSTICTSVMDHPEF